MKRRSTIAAAILTAAALAGCSSNRAYDPAPTAYGENGYCYYVDDPAEAVALQQAGMCPVNWRPAPMTSQWRSNYAWYYDSPRYYDTYVPASRRTVYVKQVRVYEKANPQAVKQAPKPAKSTAKSSVKYSSGNGRSGGDAGTSNRKTTTTQKSSSSKSYSSGSRSSSSRSYSSGSRR